MTAPPRHAIDSIEFLAVTGWAVSAQGRPGEVSLWLDGKLLPARVDRIARPDVLQHLGLATDALDCGFELRPEPVAWLPHLDGEPLVCELRVDGQAVSPVAMGLSEPELRAWIDATNEPLVTPAQQADSQRLRALLDAMGRPACLATAQEAGLQRDAPRPEGWRQVVDRMDGMQVIGWAHHPGAEGPVFTVHSHGQAWRVHPRRVPREDVRQALAGAPLLCGFELDLPSAIWRTAGRADAWVQVRVDGQPLWSKPRRLTRAALAKCLQEAVGQLDLDGVLAAETACRLWQLVEHATAAGVLGELPAATRQALRRHVGDDDWVRLHDGARQAVSAAGALDVPEAGDRVAPQVWQLQRALNDAIDPHVADRAAALSEALERVLELRDQVAAPVMQGFLAGLVPAFCAAKALPVLRPRLAPGQLEALACHDGRWELSLLLAVRVLDELPGGRLPESLSLMQRMARPGTGGWLNTEAVHDAVHRLVAALASGQSVDDAEVERFMVALVDLWDDLARAPVWSRLQDDHLVAAQCALLGSLPYVGVRLADQIVQAALRQYGLTPSFWARWEAESPDVGQWPPALVEARRRAARLAQADASDWAWARQTACGEVDSLQRHALVGLRHHPDAAGTAAMGLPRADMLRLTDSGPLAEGAWRSLSPVPWPDRAPRRERAWAAVQRLSTDADPDAWSAGLADLREASGEGSGFLGLPLLLRVALAARPWQDRCLRALDELSAAMDRALGACERARAEYPLPPQAVCAAWLGCASWPQERPDGPAAGLCASWADRWDQRAAELWGSPLSMAASKPATPASEASVLVIVRAGRDPVPGALERIAQGWAAELAALAPGAFDFHVWDPQGGAASAPWPRLCQTTFAELLQGLPELGAHSQFVLLDDDVQLQPLAWLARTPVLSGHYNGLADTSARLHVELDPHDGAVRIDVSPSDTRVGRVSLGLTVSRHALAWAVQRQIDPACPPWARAARDDEKRLADLLRSLGLPLSEEGQWVSQRRLPGPSALARHFCDLPLPGQGAPTVMVLGHAVSEPLGGTIPSSIWPTDRAPALRADSGSQQLVRLRDPFNGSLPASGDVGVFAVARNESLLMPHFLAHYRGLGVRRFVIADNLSTDGTRELLAQQPDVTLYSVDTPYRLSHYGVAWQLAMLAEHAQGRWALVVDIDEFLVWPGCEQESLAARCERLQAAGLDAAWALMVDMYPQGPLDNADFTRGSPFAEAPCFDAQPALPWRLGSGSFSNSPSFVSSVRHRLLPGSPPNHYTSQKVPLVRYHPGLRWSEGLHYAAGVQRAREPMFLAHFKYHGGFRAKVEEEIARKQHYNDAEEYRKYLALWAEARGMMFDPVVSRRYLDSHSFADIAWN